MNKPDLRIYRDAKTNQPATADASVKMKLRDIFPSWSMPTATITPG
ncbi:MAG: hypothetical protein U1D30_06375 [Planctomycetota bacterium]